MLGGNDFPSHCRALTHIRSAANCGPGKLFRPEIVCGADCLCECACCQHRGLFVLFSQSFLFFNVTRKPSLLPSPSPIAAIVQAADLSIVTATRGCGSATHSRPRVLFAHNGKSSGSGGFPSFPCFPCCFPTFPPTTQEKA